MGWNGARDGDHLEFDWRADERREKPAKGPTDVWNKSEYWKQGDGSMRFKYQSCEQHDPTNSTLVTLTFDGDWRPSQRAPSKQVENTTPASLA